MQPFSPAPWAPLFLASVLASCIVDDGQDDTGVQQGDDTANTRPDDSGNGGDDSGSDDSGSDDSGSDDSGTPPDDSGTVPDDSGTDTGIADCTDDAILDLLSIHLADLAASGVVLVGHAGKREAVGLFVLPGWVGVSAQYATLVEACTEPLLYDSWCDGALCWQLECTGKGASVITHGWLAHPVTSDEVAIDEAAVDTLWSEETGDVTYDLVSSSTGPDKADISVDGTGTLQVDGTHTLIEAYTGLGLTLKATLTGGHVEGELLAEEVVVARTDDAGQLVATGDCP
jgi:hypothetical protein